MTLIFFATFFIMVKTFKLSKYMYVFVCMYIYIYTYGTYTYTPKAFINIYNTYIYCTEALVHLVTVPLAVHLCTNHISSLSAFPHL